MPPTYVNGHISATGDPIHFMFGSRVWLSGTADERRYLRFEQIKDGGHRHVGKISSGDISATGRPIHFMFGHRVGFSRTADLMALFSIRTNSRWQPPPSWLISKGHISGHLCDSTAFLFLYYLRLDIPTPRTSGAIRLRTVLVSNASLQVKLLLVPDNFVEEHYLFIFGLFVSFCLSLGAA